MSSFAKEFAASLLRKDLVEQQGENKRSSEIKNGHEGVNRDLTHPAKRDLELAVLPDSDRAIGLRVPRQRN